ncbi:hypothetical protein PQX77_010677 [Marasmius sp. AFHP31]|nr:hypothetical protein PQX77_010677 [Marasmius sp. AFHP31]
MPALHAQTIVPAPASTKIRLSLLSTAIVDALGAPPEFKQRFHFPLVTSMIPNQSFGGLPPGVWTDDTSMTLCLARSLTRGFDEHDQMALYTKWMKEGYLSAVDRCFDVGATVSEAIRLYSQLPRDAAFRIIRGQLGVESKSGNGSLMRVLPVGLVYWRDEAEARRFARKSSLTTHPYETCQEACEVWVGAISMIITAANSNAGLTKLQVLEYFAQFPYKDAKLRAALTSPIPPPHSSSSDEQKEAYYRTYHPILNLIAQSEFLPRQSDLIPHMPAPQHLSSSGYVVSTLVAALYTFLATSSFDEGAIFVVNLCDDADTVGAVYAGLAACWYAEDNQRFWNKRMRGWKKDLKAKSKVEEVAEEVVAYSHKLEKQTMPALHTQTIVPAPASTKIRNSFLSTAIVNALGAPAESKERFHFPFITSMLPNQFFGGLPPGVWSDDMSMTLCLARSLATRGFDEHDQMALYMRWMKEGYLSAVDRCFKAGRMASEAVRLYSQSSRDEAFRVIQERLAVESKSGNGSLMRVLPVGLVYWRDEAEARKFARKSSSTTHPYETCQEACEVWVGAISMIIKAANSNTRLTKLQVLEYFAQFPYKDAKLRAALTAPIPPPHSASDKQKEAHYRTYHPILKLIAQSEFSPRQSDLIPHMPAPQQLSSSAYVVDTLVAALYTFLATSSFDEGAMFVVNLCDDADTVGAVYAGLAACWYAEDNKRFWNERMQGWKRDLKAKDKIEEVAEEVVSCLNK